MMKLLQDLLSKFVLVKCLLDKDGKFISPKEIKKLDVLDATNWKAKCDFGTKATFLLRKFNGLEKMAETMKTFIATCTNYLIKYLLIEEQFLMDANSLSPHTRQSNDSMKTSLRLTVDVSEVLGKKALQQIFHFKADQTKFDLIDQVKREFLQYQLDEIPVEYYQKAESSENVGRKRPSYWKEAHSHSGIEMQENETNQKPIDGYWRKVSLMTDEQRVLNYPTISSVVKSVLVLSHGNRDPERGFSINKAMLNIYGDRIQRHTLQALRLIKDFLVISGGSMKFTVTPKLRELCKMAHVRYEEFLKAEREEKQRDHLAKEAEHEKIEMTQKMKEKDLKEEKLAKYNRELNTIKEGIMMADRAIEEANTKLVACASNFAAKKGSAEKNQRDLISVQTKIEMGIKREKELAEEKKILAKKAKNA